MNLLQINLTNFPGSGFIARKMKGVTVPGLGGATLYDIARFFHQETRTIRIRERAAGVTYNFLMAIPPTVLFLFSLLPFLPFENVEKTIYNILRLLSPNSIIYGNIHDVMKDFMRRRHHDVLSYGIILVIYFSSNGVLGLIKCFDKTMSLYKKRNIIERRWTAIKLTLLLIFLCIAALGVLVYQSKDLNPLIHKTFHSFLVVKLLSFTVLILLVFFAISFIYTYGPSHTHSFPFVSPGSVIATLATVVGTSIFFYLVNHFYNYNKVYGSIGTLIAFMFWLWLNTILILLGYTLNVSLLLSKLSREGK